jgi:hypothetical protein
MISPSRCPLRPRDRPGQTSRRPDEHPGSYTTARDTIPDERADCGKKALSGALMPSPVFKTRGDATETGAPSLALSSTDTTPEIGEAMFGIAPTIGFVWSDAACHANRPSRPALGSGPDCPALCLSYRDPISRTVRVNGALLTSATGRQTWPRPTSTTEQASNGPTIGIPSNRMRQ